ncbi:hypothetical protein [Saccharopolyspora aridisoli]|uniref:hypothetical protein n=1 Tax=Saccharopolyspora aridisoli TaxID=2530385 RepID=UPI001404DEED|nr:hypothetical protein [Saccharopolyspora aridisoli]
MHREQQSFLQISYDRFAPDPVSRDALIARRCRGIEQLTDPRHVPTRPRARA